MLNAAHLFLLSTIFQYDPQTHESHLSHIAISLQFIMAETVRFYSQSFMNNPKWITPT